MATLQQHLVAAPRRTLLAIARARGVRIAWDAPKADLAATLADALKDPAQLDQALHTLSRAEQAVLDGLLMAGGRLPRRYVARRHGDIRPYRPWRADAPRRPWEDPASPVERLCFLGLVFLDRPTDDLLIPDDLIPHLPLSDQASPRPASSQGSREPASWPAWRSHLCLRHRCGQDGLVAAHDLACLLALLQADDVRPLHGRWLPPRLLAGWGERCALPPLSPHARGELQVGRRRFLHYLAEAAGLVGLAGPCLKPTPAAWLWLDASPAEQLNALWEAFIAPDAEQWRTYRLPGHDLTSHPDRLVAAVTQALPTLDPADPDAFAGALLARELALYDLLPPDPADAEVELTATIVDLLTGPLVWMGALTPDRDGGGHDRRCPLISLTAWGATWLGMAPPPEVPPPPRFALSSTDPADPRQAALVLTLRQGLPSPAHLMVLEAVGSREYEVGSRGCGVGNGPARLRSTDRGTEEQPVLADRPGSTSLLPTSDSLLPTAYHLSPASFARALQQGWSAPALLDALDGLAERPLTGQERATLRAWAEAAERVSIRRLTVLETSDPQVISRLAATRRGRELIVRSLSPRAVVIDEGRLEQVVRRLTRQEGVGPMIGSSPPRLRGAGRGEYGVACPACTCRRGTGGLRRQAGGSRETGEKNTSYPGLPGRAGSLLPTPNHSGAAHAWLALKVYQGLGRFIRLPARTPQALLDSLASLADPDNPSAGSGQALAAAETAAEAALAALGDAMDGRAAFPPWPEAGLPVEESLASIEQALAEGKLLAMDYYTAGRDALTHRVVEPYRLEQRGDVHYLVGFCRRAQAERVFRLDRIRHIAILKPDDEKG